MDRSENDDECGAMSFRRFCKKMTGVSNDENGSAERLNHDIRSTKKTTTCTALIYRRVRYEYDWGIETGHFK